MSPQPQRLQGVALALHFIAPTAAGIIYYILLALFIVGGHTVFSSMNGSAYPASLNGELIEGYTTFILQPLATITSNHIFNNVISLGIWAISGWIVFSIIAAIAGAVSEWRQTRQDISVPREGVVVKHPLQRNLLAHMLWRFNVSLCMLLFTLLILPVISFALASDLQALATTSLGTGLSHIAVALAIWVALFHCYVVLLRLYVLRTRVFGEIIY